MATADLDQAGVPAPDFAPADGAAPAPMNPPRFVRCPTHKCPGRLHLAADGNASCPACRRKARAHLFTPVPPLLLPLLPATGNEAVCANHPHRKAQTLCCATGDYICPLCTAVIAGNAYSVAYLGSESGKSFMDAISAQVIPRPDSLITTWAWCCVVPPVFFFGWLAAPVVAPLSALWWVQTLRLRKNNPLAKQVITGRRLFGVVAAWALATIIFCVVILGIIMAIRKQQAT